MKAPTRQSTLLHMLAMLFDLSILKVYWTLLMEICIDCCCVCAGMQQRGEDNARLRLTKVEFDAIRLQHLNLFPDPVMADPAQAIVHYRAEALEVNLSNISMALI